MKHITKLASLLLAIVMLFALAMPVFAATVTPNDGDTDNGKITINNAVVDQVYTLHQILDLESYNESAKAYAYKSTSAWKTFVESAAIKDIYLETDDQGYVTWAGDLTVDRAEEFGKLAKAFAENLTDNQGQVKASSETVVFENLDLGYYLVETSLGTICSIDTTNPAATLVAKNVAPTIKKSVQENSTGDWGQENTAEIGETVNFRTIVYAKPGALNYMVHDKMSEGLTFVPESLHVMSKIGSNEHTELASDCYTLVTENLDDGCDFHLIFKKEYLDTITQAVSLGIGYSAVLNEKAVISSGVNTNETKLHYGEEPYTNTEWATTKTQTLRFDVVKVDSHDKILDGAKFELYNAKTGGDKIALVQEKNGVYHIATEDEKKVDGFVSAVIEPVNGVATIKGVDFNKEYYLEETAAPLGYNKLGERVNVTMGTVNRIAVIEDGAWVEGGVRIINQTGSELPSTGGMGTTLFYIVGAVLMLGAVVVLVAKKRTSYDD